MTTLQKLLWMGGDAQHRLCGSHSFRSPAPPRKQPNRPQPRPWDEDERNNTWQDWQFQRVASEDGDTFIDDDLLGYMTAEAARKKGKPVLPTFAELCLR